MDEKMEDDNEGILQLASQLNSDLYKTHDELLDTIQVTNSAMKAFGTDETLIAVGSCLDGSKVNTPRDSGDIDILIVSGNVELSEHLFQYVPGLPAFLTVPITGEHSQFFNKVEPVGDNCLPASTLQEMENEYFSMVKFVMTSNLLPKGADDKMRLVKQSKVGLATTEVSGVLSDPGGVLELPKQTPSRGEGVFNVLTCLNEAVDVMKEVIPTSEKARMKVKSNECKAENDGYKPGKYENVGDIFYLLGNTINKFNRSTDSDSEKPDEHCFEAAEGTSPIVNHGQNIARSDDSKKKETLSYSDEPALYSGQTHNACVSDQQYAQMDTKETNEILSDQDGGQIGTSANFVNTEGETKIGDESTHVEYDFIQCADFVPAFKFSGWPRVAEEWRHRERKWPPSDVIEDIVKTRCQVIVKPLPDKVNDDGSYTPTDDDNMFRLSFALHELTLAKSLNKTQITCWKILKAFQKSFFEITPRVMTSYLWKNAVFWIIEKTDPSFWKSENTLYGTIMVLDFALECLKNRDFPQYFVRDMNLIKHCSVDAVEKAVAIVIMLKGDPVSHLKHFIESPPETHTLKVTSTDIQNILKSKDKNYEFGFVKVELLNTFSKALKSFRSDKDDGHDRFRSRLREGTMDVIEQMKSVHEKRHTDVSDEKRTLLNNCLDSFKELFSTVGDSGQNDSGEDVGIPSNFQKTVSSMLSLILHQEGKKEQTQSKSSGQKRFKPEPKTEMKLDDLDLD